MSHKTMVTLIAAALVQSGLAYGQSSVLSSGAQNLGSALANRLNPTPSTSPFTQGIGQTVSDWAQQGINGQDLSDRIHWLQGMRADELNQRTSWMDRRFGDWGSDNRFQDIRQDRRELRQDEWRLREDQRRLARDREDLRRDYRNGDDRFNGRDLREDRRELRQDEWRLREDRERLAQDREDLRRDYRNGDDRFSNRDLREDRRELRQDEWRLREDQERLASDRADLRRDLQNRDDRFNDRDWAQDGRDGSGHDNGLHRGWRDHEDQGLHRGWGDHQDQGLHRGWDKADRTSDPASRDHDPRSDRTDRRDRQDFARNDHRVTGGHDQAFNHNSGRSDPSGHLGAQGGKNAGHAAVTNVKNSPAQPSAHHANVSAPKTPKVSQPIKKGKAKG